MAAGSSWASRGNGHKVTLVRVDYTKRTELVVDDMYRRTQARGGVGWADILPKYEEFVARLQQLVQEHGRRGGRMLEVGCGAGDIAFLVAPTGLFDEIQGMDISEFAITWAKQKAEQKGLPIQFHVGNMVDLRDFADDSFDAIVAVACLHWIIGDDRPDCFASLHRVLRPGGRLYVLTTPGDPAATERGDIDEVTYFDPETRYLMKCGLPYFHLKTREEILAELEAVGFTVLHWELMKYEYDDDRPLVVVAAKPEGAVICGACGSS